MEFGKFIVGKHVRLVCGQDDLDEYEKLTIGEEGVVMSANGFWVAGDYQASYDYIVSFPSYENLCCYRWQLEPLTQGKQPAINEAMELML